jgi:hypothetical protein
MDKPTAWKARQAEIDAAAAAADSGRKAVSEAVARRAEQDAEEISPWATLIGFAIAVLLVALGLWVVNVLNAEGQMEDCLMAHRANCGGIVVDR